MVGIVISLVVLSFGIFFLWTAINLDPVDYKDISELSLLNKIRKIGEGLSGLFIVIPWCYLTVIMQPGVFIVILTMFLVPIMAVVVFLYVLALWLDPVEATLGRSKKHHKINNIFNF